MAYPYTKRWLKAVVVLVLIVPIFQSDGSVRAGDFTDPLPPFADVDRLVRGHFGKVSNFRPAEIISRGQVEPLFGKLKMLGWVVQDREQILQALLPEDDFLVEQLRTPAGRKFMADITNYPDAYDRLDRLSRMPYGKNIIRALIRGPDGYKMIEYMATGSGGRNLGKQLSNSPTGKDFNKPTGRIYTVAMLLTRLKKSYAAVSGK